MLYSSFLAGLTIYQLSDCVDAVSYASLVHSLLWSNFFPIILSVTFGRITFRILYNIFGDI